MDAIEEVPATGVVNLVLEGVDTVSTIEMNTRYIGSTDNMFVRYVIDVKPYLKVRLNEWLIYKRFKLIFVSPVEKAQARSKKYFAAPACIPPSYNGECHVNQLRKMQASFGWDWGPAFPSVGLWKPVYIEVYNTAIIRSVTAHTSIVDDHWLLRIVAYLEFNKGKQVHGYLTASISMNNNHTIGTMKVIETNLTDIGSNEAELNMTINKKFINCWWPNGFGEQSLYNLHVAFISTDSNETYVKHQQIGFRTVELVEENTSVLPGQRFVRNNASSNSSAGRGHTFYFKVNGYPIFMKGSNWIPAHILPELGADKNTVDRLLLSAREVHMAILRVWGGGVYESDYFYQRCDQLGILIWQDLISVKKEIKQNVLRLQHHPSIALWVGNNENEVALRQNWYNTKEYYSFYKENYIELYVHTIKPIVEGLDPGRRYIVSSPSNGRQSELEGYIAHNPFNSNFGDTHFYNYVLDGWNQNIYQKTRFASEYGYQSLPSLSTMSTATQNVSDYTLSSRYSFYRQHFPTRYANIDMQLMHHFHLHPFDPKHFELYIYYSQISQAMSIKAETEFYRQSQADWYTMEYGGKWKMLHYFAKTFFAPVLVSPRRLQSNNVDIYLLNDRLVPINGGIVTIDYFNWSSLTPIKSVMFAANAEPLSAKKLLINIELWKERLDEIFLRFSLKAVGVTSSPDNYLFPERLKYVSGLMKPTIQVKVSNTTESLPEGIRYIIDVIVDRIVLFLWLESSVPGGHFVDNGFIVTKRIISVHYLNQKHVAPQLLERSINYRYLL
ncbi:hypothetical protein MSG28_007059 [Choristoneura fumiferana]|uniref:Uncharacterized protein n=2 Tax=Choristoneura fumiferana TaxID=7141 RepID=A0ACC0JM91_CHOFU|nr:hypothetical protein MSG28_007059 [Choristoneura fumiferana]